jgi:putative transposase
VFRIWQRAQRKNLPSPVPSPIRHCWVACAGARGVYPSRKQKGSSNHRQAKAKLARLHARIANIRSDALHKLTSDLTRRFPTIGIEDLKVCGMMANRHLARSITDMSFHAFRRPLEYTAERRGGWVVVADRGFPSRTT